MPPGAFSWALYDFANTIFSAIVVTVYLPLHLTHLLGKNAPLGIAATSSMILSGLAVPALGALSDRTGKTKSYLLVATTACCLFTAGLSLPAPAPVLLAVFAGANLLFHASLVFYNSLLPVVAPPEKQGLVSGVGTGLGYLGVFLALPAAHAVDTAFGRRWVFLLAACLFFLFALPLFFRVPERAASRAEPWGFRESLRLVRTERDLAVFLLGNFFLVDALNACILWLSVFLARTYSLPQGVLIQTLLGLNLMAFLAGLFLGRVTDRLGAKNTLLAAAVSLAVTLASLGLLRSYPAAAASLLVFGALAASGIWTAGRKLLVELAPPGRLGECFGLYGFTSKVSAVGSTTFSVLADFFGFRTAVLSQLLSVALGFVFLSRVRRGIGGAERRRG